MANSAYRLRELAALLAERFEIALLKFSVRMRDKLDFHAAPAFRKDVERRYARIGVYHDKLFLCAADDFDKQRLRVPKPILVEYLAVWTSPSPIFLKISSNRASLRDWSVI